MGIDTFVQEICFEPESGRERRDDSRRSFTVPDRFSMSPTRIPRRPASNINFQQLEATAPESGSGQDILTSDENDSPIDQVGSADANVIVEAPHDSISPRSALPEPP